MLIKSFKDEDFVNYKKPSMFIITPTCSFKCDKENGCLMCQNSHLVHEPTHEVKSDTLLNRYINNPLTRAVVFGGLEPLDSMEDVFLFCLRLRFKYYCDDDIVIYTGYTEEEANNFKLFKDLLELGNVVIKYGRFRPNQISHYDEVLGVNLASDNQYAKRYD
jgi:organic radical activating enzyme